ncbi:HAD-superfamily [Micractinium conductrix]|uniref:HAD-superfamily n=1 Tax=Micractinium conductrix TaxID=554055 RepID=A0A2P6V972_9CHLO|nr:HAD-superfamily [Micractinium conductrix]|eukprot:PSC70629.1 HAD-superfamily [Micractinium conductrix]
MMQRLGQSFNSAGIALFARVATSDRPLALPHLSVSDIRWVNWAALRAAGFQGCVFDKDNTLTEPYSLELHPHARDSLAACQRAFDGRLVLYSNSAGLQQYDPEGKEAEHLEAALGIPVLRHREKKPAGGSEDMERHFGCKAEQLVMIGDRYLTDVVFGNRSGMLTIRPAPFTTHGEPKAVVLARAVEESFVGRWQRAGVQPPPHPLVQGAAASATFLRHPDEW